MTIPGKNRNDRFILNKWIYAKDSVGIIPALAGRTRELLQGDSFIGFVYADHEAGISMKLHALCMMDDTQEIRITYDKVQSIAGVTFRYDVLNLPYYHVIPKEKVTALHLPEEPEWLHFYEDKNLAVLRAMTDIDPFRADGFFDDVQVLLFYGEQQDVPELMWVRLERYLPETRSFQGILLNKPFKSSTVDKGDRIEVRKGLYLDWECVVAYL